MFTLAVMPLAITADDFDYNHTTVCYGWTVGKMRHLIAALAGALVAIVVDQHGGHTITGRLVDTFDDGTDGGRVVVETGPVHDQVDRITCRLPEVGVVIELADVAEAKWVAVASYRAETEQAINQARQQHPDDDGPGVWTGLPHDDCVLVTYQPASVTDQIPLFAIQPDNDCP